MPIQADHPLDRYAVKPTDYDAHNDPYEAEKSLGKGAFGIVQAVRYTGTGNKLTGKKFARKRFDHESSMPKDAAKLQQTEDRVLRLIQSKLNHDERTHMIKLVESYTINGGTNSAQHFLVMSPVADGSDLAKFLNNSLKATNLLDFDWLRIMGCLVTGLAILHQAHIRHHDIHPGNILIHGGAPLYTDFGFAYYHDDASKSHTESENPKHHRKFAAPEYLTRTKRGPEADVFALGGILYEIAAVLLKDKAMLARRATQSNTHFGEYRGRNSSVKAREAIKEACDATQDPMIEFWLHTIIEMLDFDPQKRPSAEDIMKELLILESPPMCHKCYGVAHDWVLKDGVSLLQLPPRYDYTGTGMHLCEVLWVTKANRQGLHEKVDPASRYWAVS